MMKFKLYRRPVCWLLLVLSCLAAACSGAATDSPQPEATPSTAPTTASPPSSATPEATETPAEVAVALVNGEAISQQAFEASLARYRLAQEEVGTLLETEESETIVLDDLVSRLLLAQGARQQGFSAEERIVEERLAALREATGGEASFEEWLAANSFSAELFRAELKLEIEAGWMRDQIAEAVPEATEQVLARQVLLFTEFEAQRLLGQLNSGVPFDTIVANNDPQGLGFLGWFPRGYLLQPALEEVAFTLQPGEYSTVIETEIGYHILEVLDREAAQPLTPDARLTLQSQALDDWLTDRRAQSEIEIRLP